MERRKLIALIGTSVSTATIAGCSEATNQDYEDADGGEAAADSDGQDTPDPEEVKNRDEGENVVTFGDLTVNEHELVIDEGQYSTEVTVEGIIENTGDERYDYVEVGVRVYNPDGHQLDRYFTNTQDLDGGQTWKFDVMILEEPEDVDTYDIGVQGSRY